MTEAGTDMKSFAVSRATVTDVPRMLDILSQWNMKPTPASNEVPDPERTKIDVDCCFVARSGNDVVGVASYIIHSDTLAETASLAVDRRYTGQGIGSSLQMARMTDLWKRGIRTLRTEADRPETVAWYKKHFGYKEIGHNPKKHAFGLLDVEEWVVLECDLGAFFGGNG